MKAADKGIKINTYITISQTTVRTTVLIHMDVTPTIMHVLQLAYRKCSQKLTAVAPCLLELTCVRQK